MTRRQLLGAGAAGASAAVLGACADDGPSSPADGEIQSVRVADAPVGDPRADAWDLAPVNVVALEAQIYTPPFRLDAVVPEIRVRSLHDRRHVAFLLEWNDPEPTDSTVRVDAFRDACAVLLGDRQGPDELRFMGTQEHPVTILQWKADWQSDVDDGVATIDREFPNRSIDAYPPLVAPDPVAVTASDYVEAGATEWLPGLHVGNALSAPSRSTPVEKMIAYGFGTTTATATQDGIGRGVHSDVGWSVVIAKPIAAHDAGELHLELGGTTKCAFAVWSGTHGDAGSRKSPSARLYHLVLRDRRRSSR